MGQESNFQGLLSQELQKQADLEAEIQRVINLSKINNSGGTPSASGYSWPLAGYSQGSLVYGVGTFIPYGYSEQYFPGVFHTGIDIYGSAILSASAGIVAMAGNCGGYGYCVMVQNGNQLAIYGHMDSLAVTTGQSLSIGTYLGQVGSTGNSTGPHLHFEVRVNGYSTDPLGYLP